MTQPQETPDYAQPKLPAGSFSARWAGQAIVTTYHGPTAKRGACISAHSWAGKRRVPYPHHLPHDEKHHAAAMEVAAAYGWPTTGWIEAGQPNGQDRVFVLAAEAPQVKALVDALRDMLAAWPYTECGATAAARAALAAFSNTEDEQ